MTTKKALQDAIDRIESDLTEELSVKDLAESIGYSPWHFSRLFAHHVGMGPGRYVRRRRLSEVALMHYSGYTLYDAAAATGFSSVAVLIRAFRETFGCTPGQFKRGEVDIELQQRAQLVRMNLDWRQYDMKNVVWLDKPQDETPFVHSYPAALYSALVAQVEDITLMDVMGYSGFAFRLDMHEAMCMSASSVFDWESTFNFALENLGCESKRLMRLWHEMDVRDAKREQAVTMIKNALDSGQIPIVWDVLVPEWGLVVGYDDKENAFACIGPPNTKGVLRAEHLGQREIEIMDVTIVEGRVKIKTDEAMLYDAIQWAVDHGRGRHWCDRPTYAQGLEAWSMWQAIMNKMATEALEPNPFSEMYFASMACAARVCATRFLREKGSAYQFLLDAADSYAKVVDILSPMVRSYGDKVSLNDRMRFATMIGEAEAYERKAMEYLEAFLDQEKSS